MISLHDGENSGTSCPHFGMTFSCQISDLRKILPNSHFLTQRFPYSLQRSDLIHLVQMLEEICKPQRGEGVDVQSTLLKSEVGDLNGWQKRLESGLDGLLDKLQSIHAKDENYTLNRKRT